MITAKNLQKAGIVAQSKTPLGRGFWYRDWIKHIRDHPLILIEVTETESGTFTPALITGTGEESSCVELNLTTVTELLTLAKLLK